MKNFIKLDNGTLVNIAHIIAVDELASGNALIVTVNEAYVYEDSRGKDKIEQLINEAQDIRVSGSDMLIDTCPYTDNSTMYTYGPPKEN